MRPKGRLLALVPFPAAIEQVCWDAGSLVDSMHLIPAKALDPPRGSLPLRKSHQLFGVEGLDIQAYHPVCVGTVAVAVGFAKAAEDVF